MFDSVLEQQKIQKANELRKNGLNPYAHFLNKDMSIKEFRGWRHNLSKRLSIYHKNRRIFFARSHAYHSHKGYYTIAGEIPRFN